MLRYFYGKLSRVRAGDAGQYRHALAVWNKLKVKAAFLITLPDRGRIVPVLLDSRRDLQNFLLNRLAR
jgi:hypothetical protein